MLQLLLINIFLLASRPYVVFAEVQARLCAVSNQDFAQCERFLQIFPLSRVCEAVPADCIQYSCVQAVDCVDAVTTGAAELAIADPLAMVYHHNKALENGKLATDDIKLVAAEAYGEVTERSCGKGCGAGHEYKAVAVVKAQACKANLLMTLRDLRDKVSCHGEYGDLAGWVIPVTKLKDMDLVTGQNDVNTIKKFFSESCAPSDGKTRLCDACNSLDCSTNDAYAGPEGVLECLRHGNGEVGFLDNWTMLGSGLEGDSGAANLEDFRVLCEDGCQSIVKYDLPGCSLATVPAKAVVARVTMDSAILTQIQTELEDVSTKDWFQNSFGGNNNPKGILFSRGTDSLVPKSDSVQEYLGTLFTDLEEYLASAKYDVSMRNDSVKKFRPWVVALATCLALVFGIAVGCFGFFMLVRRRSPSSREQIATKNVQMHGSPPRTREEATNIPFEYPEN